VCPIAAEEISGAHALLATARMSEHAVHVVIEGIESDKLDAALDLDTRTRQVFPENAFGFGLRDEKDERVSRVNGAHFAERRGDRTGSEVNDQSRADASARDYRITEPQGIEHLERPGLDRERAGFVRSVERSIDDAEGRPEPS